MEKTAFLYAGQGSQYTGMGKDLYESFPEFREVIDSLTLGLDVKKVSFENPDGLLDKTEYTQPCMVAFACGINQTLKKRGIMYADFHWGNNQLFIWPVSGRHVIQ